MKLNNGHHRSCNCPLPLADEVDDEPRTIDDLKVLIRVIKKFWHMGDNQFVFAAAYGFGIYLIVYWEPASSR